MARTCALNALAAPRPTRRAASSSIRRIVKLTGFVVASAPDFTGQPQVVNGASELLLEIFGDAGLKHARSAVGTAVLPLNAPGRGRASIVEVRD